MLDYIALAAVILWPVIPIFWIPVHCRPDLFKRIGLLTYMLPAALWTPLAVFLYMNRAFLLEFRFDVPFIVILAGIVFLLMGLIMQILSGRLLSLVGLLGLPELTDRVAGRLVTGGIHSLVRHPTYLSHSLMFLGVFMSTGIIAAGIVFFMDFALIQLVIIPLEERELALRFGQDYLKYKEKVPRFFPRIIRRSHFRNVI